MARSTSRSISSMTRTPSSPWISRWKTDPAQAHASPSGGCQRVLMSRGAAPRKVSSGANGAGTVMYAGRARVRSSISARVRNARECSYGYSESNTLQAMIRGNAGEEWAAFTNDAERPPTRPRVGPHTPMCPLQRQSPPTIRLHRTCDQDRHGPSVVSIVVAWAPQPVRSPRPITKWQRMRVVASACAKIRTRIGPRCRRTVHFGYE